MMPLTKEAREKLRADKANVEQTKNNSPFKNLDNSQKQVVMKQQNQISTYKIEKDLADANQMIENHFESDP